MVRPFLQLDAPVRAENLDSDVCHRDARADPIGAITGVTRRLFYHPCFATRLGGVSGGRETQGWRDSSHTAHRSWASATIWPPVMIRTGRSASCANIMFLFARPYTSAAKCDKPTRSR